MVKEVEELIKIVGKGNLLETLFIFLGGYQNAYSQGYIDFRNHLLLSAFIKKKKEPLDKYFNLMFSLQGLFVIYAQTYQMLKKNNQSSAKEVIDYIYAAVTDCKVNDIAGEKENEIRELNKIISQGQLTENKKKFKLLNILANPKGKTLFNNNDDFEKQVLDNVKKLLETSHANEFDEEFSLYKEVINHYYFIHDINMDKNIALLLCITFNYKKLSPCNKIIEEGTLKIIDDISIIVYLLHLASIIRNVGISHKKKGLIEYTAGHETMPRFGTLPASPFGSKVCPENIIPILKQLLNTQNSSEFEKIVTNTKHIYYSDSQEENKCRPNFIVSKKKEKDHKNTVCKLILGMFVLSVGLYVADYFLMEQKLFNSIKNVLPQDNLTNLIVGAVLTIVIVYALFQLSQKPPLSTVNGMTNENLEQPHAKQA